MTEKQEEKDYHAILNKNPQNLQNQRKATVTVNDIKCIKKMTTLLIFK